MFYKILFMIILSIIIIIFLNINFLKVTLLNLLVVSRGILAPNCSWYNVSDLLLKDGAGVNLYNNYKQKYGDFVPSYMFGKKVYIVTNNKYIKTILNNSPNLFNVGTLKKSFFKLFMENNVGVSTGCPWKRRRHINEVALVTDKLHIYAKKYNNDIIGQLKQWDNKNTLVYNDFYNLGKKMVEKIVFNTNHISDDIFKIFSEANSVEVFYNPYFKINPKVYDSYSKILNYYMDNPNKNSLIELCMLATQNKKEVFHQIPHFIFPIVGLYVTTIPRLLLLLCNHKNIFKKVIQEVYSINDNYKSIYKMGFLRKCILETLRLNNPVITTFRTLEEDYTFDNKYSFKKGTQFLILNNPVLREKEFYSHPNKFNPSRWTTEMEHSYYALSFNQGPQRCPGKELSIYLIQNCIYNLIKIKKIVSPSDIKSTKINTDNISQVLNPCKIKFHFP